MAGGAALGPLFALVGGLQWRWIGRSIAPQPMRRRRTCAGRSPAEPGDDAAGATAQLRAKKAE